MSDVRNVFKRASIRRARLRLAIFLTLLALTGFAAWAKGRGYKTWVLRTIFPKAEQTHLAETIQPSVLRTRPADRDDNILPANAFVAADVDLPFNGKVVDGSTLNASSVRLYRTRDRKSIAAVVNTSGAGDAIVLHPMETLDTNTQYTFEVTPAAKDTGGHSFREYRATFWTAAGQHLSDFPAAFDKVMLPLASGHMFTCVTIGPDHRLYASTLNGHIFRYKINADGTLAERRQIDTINTANGAMRLITGLTFDPAATADHLVLWVSHGQLPPQGEHGQAWIKGADDWTGRISRLDGPNLENCRDVIVNLPRAWKDHLNNQMAFGPDGAMYFCQAANTAMGAPDHKWGFRPERLLTAAILRLDVKSLADDADPINVQTEDGGHYDPFDLNAPLTIYASGIRNSYDLCWHSNGHLYAGINGSAAGGNTPATPREGSDDLPRVDDDVNGPYDGEDVPALTNVQQTEDDMLFKIEKGGYYGHPNPTRAEYVLNGGNPSPHANPFQVSAYPAGTQPDRNWRPAIYSFGKNLSPCGVIEYQSKTFAGALAHKLLYVRFSGGDDILALTLDSKGDVVESITGIEGFNRLINPVDLIEDTATGSIYVAEFGGKRITLLRPVPPGGGALTSAVSHRVCRMQLNPTAFTSGQE
ncbi:MAG TPA: Ig-like domain-containing protein [Tepidisphaeraceae bacterium]|jgi:glucose/arabinose dehydrogenase|nr:Ig-like domain-containing protein [Tepidisphaeraceae bacterium]